MRQLVLVGWMDAVDDSTQHDNWQGMVDWRWLVDGWLDRLLDRSNDGLGLLTCIRDHGHAHGSRRSELTNYLGENPGGNLGTVQANPCCWLTPIGLNCPIAKLHTTSLGMLYLTNGWPLSKARVLIGRSIGKHWRAEFYTYTLYLRR